MRKLLLGTSALAAVTLTANTALADLSISGYYEWSYNSTSSTIAANDGTSFGNDSEIKFSFKNDPKWSFLNPKPIGSKGSKFSK